MNAMNYDTMGACPGPVGCGPNPYAAYGYPGFVAPAWGGWGGDVVRTDIVGRQQPAPLAAPAQVGSLTHWDMIGQGPAPAPAPAQEGPWLQQPGPLGVSNLWWLVGIGAISLTWLAYSQGWFGGVLGGGRRRGGDFDGIAGDFYF